MEGIAFVDAQPRARSRADDFTQAVEPHYPGLVRRLTAVVGDLNAGEDLAQETYLRAYRAWSRFDGRDVRGWLYTIGLRLAFNELRSRKRLVALREEDEPTWAMRSEPDLWVALAQLEPQQRAALVLSALDGYTHAEIAAMLGVQTGTVSSWLSRSKERLRALLGDEQ
jgi:RNA polymerase sigma-70 factor (ECF subfamily)